MRSDMHKVIVERPRCGRSWAEPVKTGGSIAVCSAVDDLDGFDSGPKRAPWFPKDKHFNEHLGPLKRFLNAQAGRPWDKVYAEICAGIDRRSVIGAHVLQHVPDFVEVTEEGRRWARRSRLYVHPRTGILLRRKAEPRLRPRPVRTPDFIRTGANRAYKRYEGLWFEVTFCERDPEEWIPGPNGKLVRAHQVYGWRRIVIESKRQCNKKESARIESGEFAAINAYWTSKSSSAAGSRKG